MDMTAVALRSQVHESVQIFCAVVLLSLAAQIAIPLPFTPVPMTLQTAALWVIAASMSTRAAVTSVALYVGLGAAGLPVFALGGAGLAVFFGPRGAFLLGYGVAVWVASKLLKKTPAMIALIGANLSLYVVAIPLIAIFFGFKSAFLLGMLPFLAGDLFKVLLVLPIVKKFFSEKGTPSA